MTETLVVGSPQNVPEAEEHDVLRRLFLFVTGKHFNGEDAEQGLTEALQDMKTQCGRYEHSLRMIAERQRVVLTNDDIMADLGRFAYKAARKAVGLPVDVIS